jgi:acetyl-CoA acyltransferase
MRDVFICDYVRTPIGRYGGALARVRTDDLAALPLAALIARNPGLDPAAVGEVWLGCANQAGEDNRNVARMAVLLAGLPETVPAVTVNRLCASGMEAVTQAYRAVAMGDIEVALAGGVESMSRAPLVMPKAEAAFQRTAEVFDTTIGWRMVNPVIQAHYGAEAMPETAENLAGEFGVARGDQDAFALWSQEKAAAAAVRLAEEIVAVEVPAGRGAVTRVTADEGPRRTDMAALSGLKPIVRAGGTVTAGNASGINDGAAALIVASGEAVARHGLTPRARILGAASAGVLPRIMGYGPVPAVRRLLERSGVALDRIGVIEINEAFAAQVLVCLRELDISDDDPRVNPQGGAIALGHPLGMSGARIVGSAATQMLRTGAEHALATMCVGVGQGTAMLLGRV